LPLTLQFPCLVHAQPTAPELGRARIRLAALLLTWPPEASRASDELGIVKTLSAWIVGSLTSPIGVVALAALDSTIFVSFPGGIDAAVVILAARGGSLPWIAALLATAGSVGGAALTFWMGAKIGEHGLDRYMSSPRLERIRRKVHNTGAIGMAVLDLIPPPFPFTPFILAAGALAVDPATFFGTLTVCRLIRFGVEALLAAIYGQVLLAWFASDLFHDIVLAAIVLALTLTIVSMAKLFISSRSRRQRVAA
jgi:membrane protein YqaA with SNARE-associated domain